MTTDSLFSRARIRSRGLYLVLIVVAGLGLSLAAHDVVRNMAAIEAWMSELGPWSMVLYVTLFVAVTSILIPESPLSVAAGALFGLVEGMAVVIVAGLLAAVVQYFLSRKLLGSFIESRLAARPDLAVVRDAVMQDEFRMQLLLRLTPLSPTLLNYVLGAAGARFPVFFIASLGMLPTMLFEVYLGHVGTHVAHMAGRKSSTNYFDDGMVFLGLAVTAGVVVMVSRRAQKIIAARVALRNEPATPR